MTVPPTFELPPFPFPPADRREPRAERWFAARLLSAGLLGAVWVAAAFVSPTIRAIRLSFTPLSPALSPLGTGVTEDIWQALPWWGVAFVVSGVALALVHYQVMSFVLTLPRFRGLSPFGSQVVGFVSAWAATIVSMMLVAGVWALGTVIVWSPLMRTRDAMSSDDASYAAVTVGAAILHSLSWACLMGLGAALVLVVVQGIVRARGYTGDSVPRPEWLSPWVRRWLGSILALLLLAAALAVVVAANRGLLDTYFPGGMVS
ncbi:hypothetical protein GCM10022198_01840 [Klugiella xanthotipulae]|uniref:Uncharacterized protein n=1 Tax=Klugiella xanthotipulae TaxID=244735 RepID=A0A543I535_9MICO|nr:hypothetical protein [Klugiella xanthotipulae]TQM65679.1 hypothetical protein FB466_0490 [Klugiella xanthotipulae]